MRKISLTILLLIKLAWLSSSAVATPIVVTSIKPLYNIAAAISSSVFTPILLVEGNISEHDFQLKPSQITQINQADLVLWVGPDLETSLTKPLENIRKNIASQMMAIKGIKLLPNRQLSHYELSNHDHHHHHASYDPHIWLSIDNALIIAEYIAHKLSAIDPRNKNIYEKNFKDFATNLQEHKSIWAEKLATIEHLPLVVMHDAYQYLGPLNIVGTIVVDHDIPSSVKHIRQLKEVLIQQNVKCICSEPQLNALIVKTLTEDHKIKHIIIDPLGNDEDLGPHGYIKLIDNLAASLYSCQDTNTLPKSP